MCPDGMQVGSKVVRVGEETWSLVMSGRSSTGVVGVWEAMVGTGGEDVGVE